MSFNDTVCAMDDKMYSFILSAKQLPDKFFLDIVPILSQRLVFKTGPQNCPQNCPQNGTSWGSKITVFSGIPKRYLHQKILPDLENLTTRKQ